MRTLTASLALVTCALCALLLLPARVGADGADVDRAARPAPRPGLGRLVLVRQVTDVHGKTHAIEGPTVFALVSTTCPLSRKYMPTLGRLGKRAAAGELALVLVDVQGDDTPEQFAAFCREYGFAGGTLVHDPERALATTLGATTTTEVFLVDGARTLVYRGAIDDQYGIGVAHDAPRQRYLDAAIAAVVARKQPAVASTSAPGCALNLGTREPAREKAPTYHGTVARILQNNCQQCHRTGGLAPFALETYGQAKASADMISWVVREGLMPPWGAAKGNGTGPWANDCSLSARDKADLLAWVNSADKPAGDPADGPAPRQWPDGWTIGTPQVVIPLPRDVPIKAEGRMPYVNLRVDTQFTEDRWVKAWEVRPSARDVVHHVLVFVVPKGSKRRFGERSGFLAAYVPGNSRAIYPNGLAKKIPAGASLHFQLHYTPSGKPRTDRTELGLIFTESPTHEVRTLGIAQPRLRIPAGAKAHAEKAHLDVPVAARLLGMMPHMHYRGKAFKYELVRGGERTLLLDVPTYDFNWQLSYYLKTPLDLAPGNRIEVTAVYDNSEGNPANPDPTANVRWGAQSEDEMMIGYIEYYLPGVKAGDEPPSMRGTPAQRTLSRLDRDGDGKLSERECPPRLRALFARLDVNRDGFVDRDEVKAADRNRRRR